MEYRDYYATLGVARTATQAEIKKAFRTLAREHHPDVAGPDASGSDRRFKEINEAYDVLGDPDKRARYDQLGASWDQVRQGGGTGGDPFAGAGGFPGGVRFEYRGNPEDLAGFSDFFRTFFAGDPSAADPSAGGSARRGGATGGSTAGGGRSRRRFGGLGDLGDLFGAGGGASRGGQAGGGRSPALTGEVEVGLEEVAAGASTLVQAGDRRLEVTIPAGIEDGKKIRLPGRGGEPEILLTVRVRPHPVFERTGADLARELPITLAEALLGAEVPVGTLSGRTLMLTVPAGTQAGRTFRLRGQGLPRFRAEGRGDLLVRTRVVLPGPLDPDGERLARQLADHIRQPDPRGSGATAAGNGTATGGPAAGNATAHGAPGSTTAHTASGSAPGRAA